LHADCKRFMPFMIACCLQSLGEYGNPYLYTCRKFW
jgi:hypothetical protein